MSTPEEILRKYWGYDSFREKQLDIINSVLAGNDTLGLLPTGGGKSITFQVPALLLPGLTIVVTPLISLMKDQVPEEPLTKKDWDLPKKISCMQKRRRSHNKLVGKVRL